MLRDQFFAQAESRRTVESVETPAGKVFVHSLTAGEKDRFDIAHAKAKGEHFRARLLVATARDEEGDPVFGEGDVEMLSECPVSLLEPIVEVALRVNRMTDKDAESVEKN